VDAPTVAAYDAAAGDYARDWLAQPAPDDMYALLARYFKAGGLTADIGCGAGRDTAWLAGRGYAASGYDPSAGLLEQARGAYPGVRFEVAGLPGLGGIGDAACDNVMCETVIMHLPPAEVPEAVKGLTRILKVGGTLYLSWRVSAGEGQRDKAGRLYAGFDAGVVRGALPQGEMLLDAESTSGSSGKTIHRVIFRKV
jgi:SAM-dependent methyltransferase